MLAPTLVALGQLVTVVASARNMGLSDVCDVVLCFSIPDGFRVLREPNSTTMSCAGDAQSGYVCTSTRLARFDTDDVLLVLEPVGSPQALTFSCAVSGAVPDDTPGNNQATGTVPYDDTLPAYRPAQFSGGGFACGLAQASLQTASRSVFSIFTVLLLATVLRHVRRLRRGRLFRHR